MTNNRGNSLFVSPANRMVKTITNMVDRETFLQNLSASKLLTPQQFRMVVDKLKQQPNPREIAKALVSWKLITKFQARMLLTGRNCGFFLGPYRILDVLGQGGMGRVYKAMHQTMKRVVALKILAPQLLKTERAHRLFLREVQAAAQLSHPNIVMAYDANEIDSRHYLAMEFVDGPNLETYVRNNGTLPVGMACEVIFQAANGLQHAFERGMVHRDIKPANLLLHREPGSSTVQVKILDFGLARLHPPTRTPSGGSMTIAVAGGKTIMGTPDFLSPEQSRDLHDVDIRSDLYSLGCTFFYLLTGQVPFPGGSVLEKLTRHADETARPIEEMRPDVPKATIAIVLKLMAKNPDDRFQTPDELMDALAPFAAPSVMDWPIAPPVEARHERNTNERYTGERQNVLAAQVDTEPRALPSTDISDHDSILEWVDTNRRHRRKVRTYVIAALAFAALLGMGVAGLMVWVMTRTSG
jgi:serine/threonine protein kinase